MDHRHITAAGILFFSMNTKRRLFLLRSATKHRDTWGLVGGKLEGDETLLEGLIRECQEEVGSVPNILKVIPVEQFTSDDERFVFHTFICVINDEFAPVLNHEHHGYCWLDKGKWPKPLHPGLWSTIGIESVKRKITQVEDAL